MGGMKQRSHLHVPTRRQSVSAASSSPAPKADAASNAAPAPTTPAPSKNHRSHAAAPKQSKKKRLLSIIGAVIVLAIIAASLYALFGRGSAGDDGAIDNKKYQAVFFTNGQVYFGKLAPLNETYLKLTDIFYLQSQSTDEDGSDNPQNTAANSQADVQLIKLGDEVHGPDDQMVISRDQVMFYENLKADGKVSQSIAKYNSNR